MSQVSLTGLSIKGFWKKTEVLLKSSFKHWNEAFYSTPKSRCLPAQPLLQSGLGIHEWNCRSQQVSVFYFLPWVSDLVRVFRRAKVQILQSSSWTEEIVWLEFFWKRVESSLMIYLHIKLTTRPWLWQTLITSIKFMFLLVFIKELICSVQCLFGNTIYKMV